MGKRRFTDRQRGGGSRRKGNENAYRNGPKKKVSRSRDEVVDSPSPCTSGDSDVEHNDIVSDGESEEMVEVQKENTMYDNLLNTLGSASESLASANKRSCSAFDEHFSYKLSKDEVIDLVGGKWKSKWKVPAVGMSRCKWIGTGERFLENDDINLAYDLKPRLYTHWLDNYKASGGKDFHSSRQRSFFSLCNNYRDILHHNKKPFYLKGVEENSSIMDAHIMHSLNHIFRSGDLVTKNDAKVAKLQEITKNEILSSDEFLDPKILILLPLASIAFRVVKRLIQLTPSKYKDRARVLMSVMKLDMYPESWCT